MACEKGGSGGVGVAAAAATCTVATTRGHFFAAAVHNKPASAARLFPGFFTVSAYVLGIFRHLKRLCLMRRRRLWGQPKNRVGAGGGGLATLNVVEIYGLLTCPLVGFLLVRCQVGWRETVAFFFCWDISLVYA